MDFSEDEALNEKGLVTTARNKKTKKVVSGLTGAAFDASYAQFVDENDEDFNDNFSEQVRVDKMAPKFHMDTPEYTENFVAKMGEGYHQKSVHDFLNAVDKEG